MIVGGQTEARAQLTIIDYHEPFDQGLTNTFLLVSSSVSSKQLLCFVPGQGRKRTKTDNKELCPVSYPFSSINYDQNEGQTLVNTNNNTHDKINRF